MLLKDLRMPQAPFMTLKLGFVKKLTPTRVQQIQSHLPGGTKVPVREGQTATMRLKEFILLETRLSQALEDFDVKGQLMILQPLEHTLRVLLL